MNIDSRPSVLELVAGFSIEKPLGGIERFVVELCRYIDPSLFSVSVFGLWNFEEVYKQRWIRQLNEAEIKTFEGSVWQPDHPYQAFVETYRQLKQTVNTHHFDIIHSHDQFGDIMGLMLKMRTSSLRLVRTAHNREWQKRPVRRALLWWGVYPWLYDAEIGVSQKIVDDLNQRATAKVLKKKGVLIPNAVSIERFIEVYGTNHAFKKEIGLSPECFVVGTIGRLTTQKGYPYFLQAAQQVLHNRQDIYFVIVGGGEIENDLRRLANELNIADNVIFTGPRSDIEQFIHTFDLFVSSSLWEGLPTVVMESMAAGIPVIATDIPGSQDLIHHEQNGWLVPAAHSQALAEAVLYAVQNKSSFAALAKQAYLDVKAYTIQNSAVLQEQVFHRVMGRQS